jgi:hypothetical protein
MTKNTEKRHNFLRILNLNLKKTLTFNRILMMVIVLGILLRVITFWTLPPTYDGNAYIAVGHSIAKTGNVMAPWGGDFGSGNTTDLVNTRISPLYPSYLAAFYNIFGYSLEITQIAGIILGIITLLIIYLTTRNLFGHHKGLIVTAIMSVTWPFISYPGMEWGDNVVLLFFVLTIWSFMKGLKDSRYMIPFGLFGALLFLTKIHSVHFIFILAPIAGFFIWRFLYMGWDVFKDKNYYFGGAIFLIITLGWQIRNYTSFAGSPEGTSFGSVSSNLSIELLLMFIMKFPFLIVLAGICFMFWIRELRPTLKKIKMEDYNALWVFSAGYLLLVWVITSLGAATAIYNKDAVFRLNHIRYIAPIYVSILWLVIKDHDWTHQGGKIRYFSRELLLELKKWLYRIFRDKKILLSIIAVTLIGAIVLIEIEFFIGMVIIFAAPSIAIDSIRKRLVIMLLAFSIASVNAATMVKSPPYIPAAKELQAILNDGDTLMVDGEWFIPEKYNLYPYLAEYDIRVMEYDENINATYIFSYENKNYTGYELIGQYYWEGELGIVLKAREKILGIFISQYREGSAPQEREPSAWLWKRI